MPFVPFHEQFHTRLRPGDVLYTIKNGPEAPPQMLIPGAGLPAFMDSLSAQQGLTAAGMPFPVGRFATDDQTHIALHDTQAFLPEDGARYRGAGFQVVELPSGEVRVLDRNVLHALPDSPLSLNQQTTGIPMPQLQKSNYSWGITVKRHHAKARHGHPASEKLSDADFDSWHGEHHKQHGERLGHTHERRGILALTKGMANVPVVPTAENGYNPIPAKFKFRCGGCGEDVPEEHESKKRLGRCKECNGELKGALARSLAGDDCAWCGKPLAREKHDGTTHERCIGERNQGGSKVSQALRARHGFSFKAALGRSHE